MTSLMKLYTRSFERRPYITLLVANGLLMGLGDFSAQTLASFSDGAAALPYDFARTGRFLFFGASMGPLAGAWNKFLEVKFPLRPIAPYAPMKMNKVKVEDNPIPGLNIPRGAKLERGGAGAGASGAHGAGAGPKTAGVEGEVSALQLAKRVAADQLGMAPISLVIFLTSMGVLEGLSDEELYKKITDNYFSILFVNWQVWPLLQLINFRFVPLKYRVPFGSVLGILWTAFLSFKTAAPKAPQLIRAD